MTARPILELRARVRARLRDLFDGLGFLEVDTPVLSTEVLPEPYIDPLAVPIPGGADRWLQASPEALMKRLLAAGSGPIYQFARSFRAGEQGRQHDLEFVLLEWYAPQATLADTATLLELLCSVALGTTGLERTTCSAAFGAAAGVDPLHASLAEMEAAVERAGIRGPPPDPRTAFQSEVPVRVRVEPLNSMNNRFRSDPGMKFRWVRLLGRGTPEHVHC